MPEFGFTIQYTIEEECDVVVMADTLEDARDKALLRDCLDVDTTGENILKAEIIHEDGELYDSNA